MSTHHFITASITSAAHPIDAHLRELLEDGYGANLRDVRLHFSPASVAANQALGSIAFAVDGHICFRSNPDTWADKRFTYLLAHEVAHIMQKRNTVRAHASSCAVPNTHLEREACMAALRVLRGERVGQVTPDTSSSPRLYGPAGHYYTAFYTAMAAGFPYDTASSIAFFTQLPDLVCELDAHVAGNDWNLEAFGVYLKSTPQFCADHLLTQEYQRFWQSYTDVSIDQMVHDWQIQAGLHSLTGGNAKQEQTKRKNILLNLKPSDVPQFGLAVHAFGDSYAHSDFHGGPNMYGPPYGHGVEVINHIIRADGWDPTDPDRIEKRGPLYIEYGQTLYKALSQLLGVAPAVTMEDFTDVLEAVRFQPDENAQAVLLKNKLQDVCSRKEGRGKAAAAFSNFYEPKHEAVKWAYFQDDHPTLTNKILDDGYRCAAEWCASAEPFKVSVYGSWSDLKSSLMQPVENFQNDMATVLGLNLSYEQFMSQLSH
jgi:hypothetical protein